MTTQPTVSLLIELDPDLHDRQRQAQTETGLSQDEIINAALKLWLSIQGRKEG